MALYNAIKLLKEEEEELISLHELASKDQSEYFANLQKQTRELEKSVAKISASQKEEYEKAL
jgi:hypothetical protein